MPRVIVIVLLLAVATATTVVFASQNDRPVARNLLENLTHLPEHRAVMEKALREARAALERGERMRLGGDEAHARLTDGLAREWAETANDLRRAEEAEQKAAITMRNAADAGARAERERAQVEEDLAHNGRMRAQLDELERLVSEGHAKTAKSALDAGTDAGGKKP